MAEYQIDPETRVGAIALTVADLSRSLAFYERTLGFGVERVDAQHAVLRAGEGPPRIRLVAVTGAQPKPPRTTGLYHYAIRVPSREALAHVLARLEAAGMAPQGVADHGVSEALYLADPDGIGIEIYRDRPREAWPRQDDELVMVTEPLDLAGLRATLSGSPPEPEIAPGTDIGHVHLQVAHLDAADHFYGTVLGLTLMQRYGGSALFFSAGGYHHHVATNTWAGVGAPPPPADTVGLRHFELRLPSAAALDRLASHLQDLGITPEVDPAGLRLADPSHNAILLTGG